jgi:predicted nuclease of predicted toxin-antitoxin system
MTRYLIDVNLPRKLAHWNGDEYVFVTDIDPFWSDQKIWDYAAANALTIVTKDADFTARVFVNQSGPRVIHFRLGNMKIRPFHKFLGENWHAIRALSTKHQLVTVFEDHVDCIT